MAEHNKPKTYVLDTSVLIHSPSALLSFDDNAVVIPLVVVKKLGELMDKAGEIGANARECNRILDSLCKSGGSFTGGIELDNGGTLKIGGQSSESIYDTTTEVGGILVTRNANQRVEANYRGIPAEDYKTEQVAADDNQYLGRSTVYVSTKELDSFREMGSLRLGTRKRYITSDSGTYRADGYSLSANEFVTLVNESNPQGTMLGRFDGKEVVKLNFSKYHPFGVETRNAGQIFAIEALLSPPETAPLVILKGAAGTAKTFLAMACGLDQTYEKADSRYKRILVSRPNTKFDDDIGYLKGDEKEKIGPLIRPVIDNLENLMPNSNKRKDGATISPGETLLAQDVITAQAMAYMRGRSICDTYIVIDEAQNATVNQILGLVTRVGTGSKIVLLGDPDQIDHPYLDRRNNGLSYASEYMKGSPLCWQVTFEDSECTRSELAAEAIARLTPKGVI